MGGLAIVVGFGSGILLAVALVSFFHVFPSVNLVVLLAVLSTVLLAGLIGIVDDLLGGCSKSNPVTTPASESVVSSKPTTTPPEGMRQWMKALLPVFAALPLMAVRAGHTFMKIPFVGTLNFWIFYPLVLVPVGVTVVVNAVNMLAGFNGVEVGLGIVAIGSLSIIAAILHETTALILLLSGLGALLGIIYFNWYPARILVGDVGTLSIGAIIATAVIVGNFETAGVIVIIPYAIDFLFKAVHRFPTSFGELREDGKLHCPAEGPVGLGQFIMKVTRGIHERTLVVTLMGIEAIFGLVAIALYVWR
ncbi:hypothetical protein KAU37_03060 [Candidatus Bipolaricaulota bacterium]|nr:hypothetical protein [Candidatus Bipolaricaulota bacterium]